MTKVIRLTGAALHPEQVVRRYFAEIVDGRTDATLDELFAPDCCVRRADRMRAIEGRDALRHFIRMSIRAVPEIRTEILSMIGDGAGNIACLVEHEARFGPLVLTPAGPAFTRNRKAVWQAMAFFRVVDGQIVEERVIRDEIAILRQLGLVARVRRAAMWRIVRSLVGLRRRRHHSQQN